MERGRRNRGKAKLKSRPLIRVRAPEKLLDLVPFNYVILPLHLHLRARIATNVVSFEFLSYILFVFKHLILLFVRVICNDANVVLMQLFKEI